MKHDEMENNNIGEENMPHNPIKETRDTQLVHLAHSYTSLNEDDIQILLEVSHSLPFIGSLENGDTYINVLTKNGESMVVAQYRHPDCDLYKRDIIGEVEKKANEPAVYRALEYGLSSRGFIGIIDEGRIIVRHTVSPIFNKQQKVIGSLTYEYLNTSPDTDPIRIISKEGDDNRLGQRIDPINQATSCLQDGFLLYDENGICTFANAKAEELYQKIGYGQGIIGRKYEELQLTGHSRNDVLLEHSMIKDEIRLLDFILEENISAIREESICRGIAVILRDKTRIRQMEDEIVYRVALLHEVHHRVKNNLQTIISLVGLEAAQTKNEAVKAFARKITGYIRSMSETYNLLAHSDSERVDLKMMLAHIVDSMMSSRNGCGCQVHVDIDGDNLELLANTASTIALIVNELIQNSMKYAFRDRDEGQIRLTIEAGQEYSWIMICDDGYGFDEKKRSDSGGGLGLRLIDGLVKSNLKGEFVVSSSNQGTTTRFSFRN